MIISIIKKIPSAKISVVAAALALAACAHTPDLIILDSDLSFEFGQAELTPEGQKQIDMYVPSLATRGETRLEVVGHTDRIGSDAANMALSKRRAEAVRDRLLSSGRLDADQIKIRGVGSRAPVVYCDQTNQQALIKCLAPNRRVEINVIDVRW